jgi:hypothetical protein
MGITKTTPVDYSTGFFYAPVTLRWDEKFIPTKEVSPSGITTKKARQCLAFLVNNKIRRNKKPNKHQMANSNPF